MFLQRSPQPGDETPDQALDRGPETGGLPPASAVILYHHVIARTIISPAAQESDTQADNAVSAKRARMRRV